MAARVLVVRSGLDLDGVEQTTAPDGEAALALLDRERFDAVVLDLALPPLDGWMLLATIGHRPDRPRVIATVGDRGEMTRARRLGADVALRARRGNLSACAAVLSPDGGTPKEEHDPHSARRASHDR